MEGKGEFTLLELTKSNFDTPPIYLKWLNEFEDLDQILFWKNSAGHDPEALIEIPRLGLSFEKRQEISGFKRLFCIQDPEFYLTSPSKWDGLGAHRGYFVLQHRSQSDCRKICIPKQGFKIIKKKTQEKNPIP